MLSIRVIVPRFSPEATLAYQRMDVESESYDKSTPYVQTWAHTRIWSLRVVP